MVDFQFFYHYSPVPAKGVVRDICLYESSKSNDFDVNLVHDLDLLDGDTSARF